MTNNNLKTGMKKIFFLVGLPRAGNTLLGSILNQNPDMAVTANSITPEIVFNVFHSKNIKMFENFPDHQSFNNIAHHIFDLYYKDWKQTYIIDRGSWGTPGNLRVLKEIQTDIKIIVLTRDIIEVLASFIRWSQQNPNNFLDRGHFKTIEEQCDALMDFFSHNLWAVNNLLLRENESLYHVVKYNDLVKYPERIIKGIYNYLEIPPFKHRYTNLDQFEINGVKYNDSAVGEKLHSIKTDCIVKSDYDAYSLIPKAIIKQYKREWLL